MADAHINRVILAFVAVLVGVILIAPLQSAANDANVTGTAATVVGLIPVLFALGILLVSIKQMM